MRINLLRIYILGKFLSVLQSLIIVLTFDPSTLGESNSVLAKIFLIQQLSELSFGKFNLKNQRDFIDYRQIITSLILSISLSFLFSYQSEKSNTFENISIYIALAISLTISQLLNTTLIHIDIKLYSSTILKNQIFGFIIFIVTLFTTNKNGVVAIYAQTLSSCIFMIYISGWRIKFAKVDHPFFDFKFCTLVTLTSIISWSISTMDLLLLNIYYDLNSTGQYSLSNNWATTISTIIFSSLLPNFQSLINQKIKSEKIYLVKENINHLSYLILLSGSFLVSFYSNYLINLNKWNAAFNFLPYLLTVRYFIYRLELLGEFLRSENKEYLELIIFTFISLISIFIYMKAPSLEYAINIKCLAVVMICLGCELIFYKSKISDFIATLSSTLMIFFILINLVQISLILILLFLYIDVKANKINSLLMRFYAK